MAAELTQTAWGYSITCTSGTAVPAVVVAKGTRLKIAGIACGGAATTDITTVQDANGKQIFKGSAIVNTEDRLRIAAPIHVDGLAVGFAGATTGYCTIFFV